jgi:hypothetical protein
VFCGNGMLKLPFRKNQTQNKLPMLRQFLVLAIGVSFCFPLTSEAQNKNKSQEIQEVKPNVKGTYQIEVIGRQQPLIPQDIDRIVKENRHKNKVIYVKIGDMVRIKVLPTSQIKSASFKPVDELIFVPSF